MMQLQTHAVSMNHFACLEEPQTWKDVWKFALVGGGELSVMTNGTAPMLLLFANSLATLHLVISLTLSPSGNKFNNNIVLIIGARATGTASFGRGEGPIFMDDVQCTGNETRLIQCPSSGIGSHNCLHFEDAGAICQRKQLYLCSYKNQCLNLFLNNYSCTVQTELRSPQWRFG